MKRSKRFLSLLLAVLVILTTVVSTTIVSTSAAGTLASYYSTNPNGQVGANKTISIDGSLSDWDSSMLIAQGTANDDPRVYRPNSMYEVGVDLYALYAAYDDNNLYLMWEMTNVQDVVAPQDDYPLSQGTLWQTQEFPFFIMVDTGKADTAIGNNGALQGGKGHIWGSGMTVQNSFNKLIAINTKGGNGPWVYGGDSTGLNPVELLTAATSKVEMGYGQGILSKNVYGIDKAYGHYNNRVPGDVCDEDAAWVDFNTLGHSSATKDFFYEMSIPFSELGITKADVTGNGIGVMVVATMGMSPMDCLPGDPVMTDQADLDDAANSQENNSFEKSDEDFITAPFARVGKLGGGVVNPPIVTQPVTNAPVTDAATTAAPTEAPTTATPTQAPTTAPVTTTEPTEAPTTAEPTQAPTTEEPVITLPKPTATEEVTTATPTIPVPTLDFDDPSETTPTTAPATKPSVPVIVPDKGILGDTDGNEKVNIKDATLIQKHLAKVETLSELAQELGNVDGNDVLNIRDVTFIQKWLAKMDVDFAIGEPVAGEEIVVPVPTAATTAEVTTATAPVVIPATTTAPATTAEPTEVPTTAEPTEVPTTAEPTVAPTTAEPTVAPTTAEPVVTEPQYTEPVYTDPIYTEPDYPDDPVGGTITIYFENTYGWSSVYWHAWNEAGASSTPWPGDPMTNVSGNIYSATVSSEYTGIIFNDGSGSDFNKTSDATIAGDGQMYSNGSWVPYDPNNNNNNNDDPYNPPIGGGKTVYFSNVNHWDTVYAYSWNDAGAKNAEWPGVPMTLVEEDNGFGQQVYSYELPADCNYIIFSNGNGHQCADINLDNEVNNAFYLTGEVVNDKGHYGYESYAR